MSIRNHTITIIAINEHHTLAVLMQLNVTLMFVAFMLHALRIKHHLDKTMQT